MLIRTKLQAQAAGAQGHTMVSFFPHVVKTQGLSALYIGLLPSLLKSVPSIAIQYVVYEYFRQLLKFEMS